MVERQKIAGCCSGSDQKYTQKAARAGRNSLPAVSCIIHYTLKKTDFFSFLEGRRGSFFLASFALFLKPTAEVFFSTRRKITGVRSSRLTDLLLSAIKRGLTPVGPLVSSMFRSLLVIITASIK